MPVLRSRGNGGGAPIAGANGGSSTQGRGHVQLNMQELMQSIESLYKDQLKPYGRILRKRLTERAKVSGQKLHKNVFMNLRSVCEACPVLRVQSEQGGDWSAVFTEFPEDFVDVHGPQDIYPANLWKRAEVHFENLDDGDNALPGGRYECAQALIAQKLPFLDGLTLGQVCHIVQLAISRKKLLGYLTGKIVPYRLSQSMAKAQFAASQQPYANVTLEGCNVATWASVETYLRDILADLSPGESVPLANMKNLFHTRFRIDLSETALGYAKLSELLQDPRLQDICAVRLRDNGYVVVPQQVSQTHFRITDDFVAQDASAETSKVVEWRSESPSMVSMSESTAPPQSPALETAGDGDGSDSGSSSTANVDKLGGMSTIAKPAAVAAVAPIEGVSVVGKKSGGVPHAVSEAPKRMLHNLEPLTPSKLERLGFRVHHTFLQDAKYNPFGLRKEARSRSVPAVHPILFEEFDEE